MDGELTYFSRLAGLLYGDAAGVAAREDFSEGRLHLETLRVRQAIVGRMGAFRADEDGRLFTCRIVGGITAIMDLADEAVLTDMAATLREQMMSALEALLSFVQQYYGAYMDMSIGLPRRQAAAFVCTGARNVARLRKLLDKRNVGAPPLRALVTGALKGYVEREAMQRTVSFGEAAYFEACIQTLSELANTAEVDEQLLRALYSLDFNDAAVVGYFVSWLEGVVYATPDMTERIACLRRLLKDFRQVTVRPGAVFCRDGEGLRATVNRWLEEELWYCKEEVGVVGNGGAVDGAESVRIKTGLTVAQHACLLKLMIEGGLIVHGNHSDVIRWWVGSVGTSRSEVVSEGSFRSKFYSVDRSTADAVRELLLNLVHLSRRI